MNYVLGLDIGIASVGWAVIDLETLQVIESCSNIFTAAEAENNKDRRSFRQMRRLKRRLRTRISDFAKMWKSLGFSIPGDIDNMPLLLRVKGISEELSMDEIYTVLLNELKHRGISYLEDFGDNANDGTDYSKSIAINQKELEEKFPCQIQYERYCKYGNYRGQFVADINGEKVGAPFIIKAIGLPEQLSALSRQGGYLEILKNASIGVELKKSNNITIPKYTGIIEYNYAKAVK